MGLDGFSVIVTTSTNGWDDITFQGHTDLCIYIYIYYVYNVYTFIYRLNSHWAKENFGPDHFNWQIFR
jgi:hypothetical protein